MITTTKSALRHPRSVSATEMAKLGKCAASISAPPRRPVRPVERSYGEDGRNPRSRGNQIHDAYERDVEQHYTPETQRRYLQSLKSEAVVIFAAIALVITLVSMSL